MNGPNPNQLPEEHQRFVAATIEAFGDGEKEALKSWLRGEQLASCPCWLEEYLRELAWDNQLLRSGLRAGILLVRKFTKSRLSPWDDDGDAELQQLCNMWMNYAAGLGERKRPT